MKFSYLWKPWILLILAGVAPGIVHGAENPQIAVGLFSEMPPGGPVSGWEPLTFAKVNAHTRYALVSDGGRTVLLADSRAAASGLVRKVDIDPQDYPFLEWYWKVGNIPARGDVTKKSGDDYAARIYVTFAADPIRLTLIQRAKSAAIKLLYGETPPAAALAYIWGNRTVVGSIHPNPYTDRVRMIVVESGPDHLNQWRSAKRDIVMDFRKAFGFDPPRISAIAVMTDTDNTGEAATAWYGDISLNRR